MAGTAPWWNSKSGQDSDVVRHAPDDNNYHYLDGRQLEHMRPGLGACVTVPRAYNNGLSMAFDGSRAGVVHVDPDAPDGGAIVDLTAVDPAEVNQALSTSRYPHEVFYKLGTAPAATPAAPVTPLQRRDHPLLAGGYVVPASDQQGRQVWAQPEASTYGQYQMAPRKEEIVLNPAPQLPVPPSPLLPPQPQPPPLPPAVHPSQYAHPGQQAYQQPQQPYYPPQPQPQQVYVPPPQPDPNTQSMLNQILQGMQVLAQRVEQVEQRRPPVPASMSPPAGVATVPVGHQGVRQHYPPPTPIGQAPRRRRTTEEEDDDDSKRVFEDDAGARNGLAAKPPRRPRRAAPQHLDDYLEEAEDEEERSGLIVGFEALKLPYVNGPLALKARRKVFFDFGEMGKQSGNYHDIIDSRECVVLVYDTRYEDGTQYEPPDLNDKIFEVHVPSLKKSFKVSSMGFSFTLGVFDLIVLVKHEDDKLDYNEES